MWRFDRQDKIIWYWILFGYRFDTIMYVLVLQMQNHGTNFIVVKIYCSAYHAEPFERLDIIFSTLHLRKKKFDDQNVNIRKKHIAQSRNYCRSIVFKSINSPSKCFDDHIWFPNTHSSCLMTMSFLSLSEDIVWVCIICRWRWLHKQKDSSWSKCCVLKRKSHSVMVKD